MEKVSKLKLNVRRLKSVKRKTTLGGVLPPTDEIRLENVLGVTVINNASIATSSSGREDTTGLGVDSVM